jgi:hypothetical protein
MPGVVMVSGGISGCGLTPLLGMLSIDSVVNTDLKIMEHVITKHVLNHLESNSLLYDLQHGFRHSRSCETFACFQSVGMQPV